MSFVRFARGIVFILGVRGLIGATPREKNNLTGAYLLFAWR